MDAIFSWDGVADCSALRSEVAGRSAGCSALWSEVASCSPLLELLGGPALPELLGAEGDKKRFMAPSTGATVTMQMFEPEAAAVMKIDFKLQHAQRDSCTYIGT